MEWKTVVLLDQYERNILINALNEFRNNLLQEQRSTDAVDELMIKIHEARQKRLRVAEAKAIERYR